MQGWLRQGLHQRSGGGAPIQQAWLHVLRWDRALIFLWSLLHKRSDCHGFNALLIPGQQTPQTIYSPGPRLVLLFKAGSKPGSGFKAQYRFETGKKPFCIQAFTQPGRLEKKLKCEMIYFQNIRFLAPLGQDCATSPTAARAGWREDSTLRDILRITPMTSTALTCSLQLPVSRWGQGTRWSHLRDDLCVSLKYFAQKNLSWRKSLETVSGPNRVWSFQDSGWQHQHQQQPRQLEGLWPGAVPWRLDWDLQHSHGSVKTASGKVRRMKITSDSCKCRGFSPRCHLLTRPYTQDPSSTAHFIINLSSGDFLFSIFHLIISQHLRYCDKSSPGPVVSPKGTVGLEMHLHTNQEGVFSGFKGRYQFMQVIMAMIIDHDSTLMMMMIEWLTTNN